MLSECLFRCRCRWVPSTSAHKPPADLPTSPATQLLQPNAYSATVFVWFPRPTNVVYGSHVAVADNRFGDDVTHNLARRASRTPTSCRLHDTPEFNAATTGSIQPDTQHRRRHHQTARKRRQFGRGIGKNRTCFGLLRDSSVYVRERSFYCSYAS